jgi:hypothetical protein
MKRTGRLLLRSPGTKREQYTVETYCQHKEGGFFKTIVREMCRNEYLSLTPQEGRPGFLQNYPENNYTIKSKQNNCKGTKHTA